MAKAKGCISFYIFVLDFLFPSFGGKLSFCFIPDISFPSPLETARIKKLLLSSFPQIFCVCVCVCVGARTNLFLNRKSLSFSLISFPLFFPLLPYPPHHLDSAILFPCYCFSPMLIWNQEGIVELFKSNQVFLFCLNACFLHTRKIKDKCIFTDSESVLELRHFFKKQELDEFSQWF